MNNTRPSFYLISSAVDGNVNAIEKILALYDPYISKCCLRPFYDKYGNVCIVVDISYRAMMGEYIIYYRDRIVGGIYDDRLLVKPTKSAVSYMATAIYELPYEGAKEMLLVEDVDSKEYLAGLFKAMYDELPVHKSNNKIMKF